MNLQLEIKSRKKFINALIDKSEADNYLMALNEWVFVEKKTMPNEVAAMRCICGQPIINYYVFNNPNTRKSICVGYECRDKFFGLDRRFNVSNITDLNVAGYISRWEASFLWSYSSDGGKKSLRDMTIKQKEKLEQITRKLARGSFYNLIAKAEARHNSA